VGGRAETIDRTDVYLDAGTEAPGRMTGFLARRAGKR